MHGQGRTAVRMLPGAAWRPWPETELGLWAGLGAPCKSQPRTCHTRGSFDRRWGILVLDIVMRQESFSETGGEGDKNQLKTLHANASESRASILVWSMCIKRSSGKRMASAPVSHSSKITPSNPLSAEVAYYSSSSMNCWKGGWCLCFVGFCVISASEAFLSVLSTDNEQGGGIRRGADENGIESV